MKVQQFLEHHGVGENPFGQEDAQADHVFRDHCLTGTHHPAWDKIYGNPRNPSTSVVFGEKGAGKTALRLQIVSQIREYNTQHPDRKVFVIEYDDFNPFLDCFRERMHRWSRSPERMLSQWRLWDHMDAILSLGVTRLVRGVLEPGSEADLSKPRVDPDKVAQLSRLQKRDLLLLAAFYDHTYDQPFKQRWHALRRKLRFSAWKSQWDLALGWLVTIATIASVWSLKEFKELFVWWVGVIILAGWLPWLWRQARLLWKGWRVTKQIRVFDHFPNRLRQVLSSFQRQDIEGQPIPNKDRSDDRYEMLRKFQNILKTLGYESLLVLVDRVDEPHLVNGAAERMKDLLWPMFDNKFLKHPEIGFKLLLPAEVVYYLNREEKEFYERSRLDKQNLIPSLEWTGESLYDVANDRIHACASRPEKTPVLRDLFEPSITHDQLVAIFSRLRVPRHLFKFLYRLLVDHCNRYTEENPNWKISNDTLQSTLAVFMRDLDAFDRGMGTG